MKHPHVIQGGMGAGVSHWKLAQAVAREGALGVVSGTALDTILARRLQQGDPHGDMRRGLQAFPRQDIANRIIARYFRRDGYPDGMPEGAPFLQIPIPHISPDGTLSQEVEELLVVAAFVEIHLARQGHDGAIGINLLEKIQIPNPALLYGAMLAGVDYVLMGAGIPVEIPGLLDRYARGEGGSIAIVVEGDGRATETRLSFDPARVLQEPPRALKRPGFLAIVSSNVLAKTMLTRASGAVDGIIVEDHTAGGHNAPPRGELRLTEEGEPIFGPKDTVDLGRMAELPVPFWLAGSRSFPESLYRAIKDGAAGIQVGTLFAFCRESGFLDRFKRQFLERVQAGTVRVFTHPTASPTGYPLKMALLEDTVGNEEEFRRRPRVCNLGLLRRVYRRDDGTLGYRCPADRESRYRDHRGDPQESRHARCLCNSLLAAVGQAMEYAGGYLEKPLFVPGECLDSLRALIRKAGLNYTAADVVQFLTGVAASTKAPGYSA